MKLEKSKFIDRDLVILFSITILVLIVGAVFTVKTLKKETLIKENTTYETLVEDISIVALSDNSSVEGDFSGGGNALNVSIHVPKGTVDTNFSVDLK